MIIIEPFNCSRTSGIKNNKTKHNNNKKEIEQNVDNARHLLAPKIGDRRSLTRYFYKDVTYL